MFKNKVEFKGAVIGMILGDGHLMKQYANENSKLMIHQSLKQEEYLKWKRDLLNYLTESNIHSTSSGLHNGLQLQTRRHPFYSTLRERMYIDGRKTVDEHILKSISVLGLAIWYQDDGCLCKGGRWKSDYSVQLYTNSFSKPEVDLIQYWLKKRFDIDFTVYKTYDKRRDKSYFFLSLRNTEKDRKIDVFFSLVKNFIHPSMKYKLGTYESNLKNEVSDIVRTSLKNEEVNRNIDSTSELVAC